MSVDSGEIRELLRGAVDLYLHPTPDFLARRIDDIGMAKEMKADEFRAAMLWVQFSSTPERATVASSATGFDMRGSIILNSTVGGISPTVVEYAIRMGARYVCLPTMCGSMYQARMSDYARAASSFAGPVAVTDASGAALPQMHDVLDVIAKYDVPLCVGYVSYAEAMAVFAAAREHGVKKVIGLRPFSVLGFTEEQVTEAMAFPEFHLQFPASTVQITGGPAGLPNGATALAAPGPAAPAIAAAIKRYGPERCILTSDTGWNDLTALQWLTAACTTLANEGIGAKALRTLVHDTPARLIGIN